MRNYTRWEDKLSVKGEKGSLVMTFNMKKRLKNALSNRIYTNPIYSSLIRDQNKSDKQLNPHFKKTLSNSI
jgi:hypothetical protein